MAPISPQTAHTWLKTPIKSDLGSLLLAGRLKNTPGIDPNSMRILGNYALIVIEHGSGYYVDGDGSDRRLAEGDMILVFPELAHAYGPINQGDWVHAYVVFEGPQFELMRQKGVLRPDDPIWHLEPVDYWRNRLEEVFQSNVRPTKSVATRAIGQFAFLLTDMFAAQSDTSQSSVDAWLEKSMQLLSHPTGIDWLRPQAVASRVGLSYENFRKRFAKSVGESPAHFQTRRRIEHACAAIYQNSHSFKKLADELGFCDVFHFSKVFSQITGETPSDFRAKARGKPL